MRIFISHSSNDKKHYCDTVSSFYLQKESCIKEFKIHFKKIKFQS